MIRRARRRTGLPATGSIGAGTSDRHTGSERTRDAAIRDAAIRDESGESSGNAEATPEPAGAPAGGPDDPPPAGERSAAPTGPSAYRPPTRRAGRRSSGGPRRLRPRTVRARIAWTVTVPVAALLALWVLVTAGVVRDAVRLHEAREADTRVRAPITDAVAALQGERSAALRRLAGGEQGAAGAVEEHARRTDRAVGRLRLDGGRTVADGLPPRAARRVVAFVILAGGLADARTAGPGRESRDAVYGAYTEVIDAALTAEQALTGARPTSRERAAAALSRSREQLAREDALLAAAGPARSLNGAAYRQFTGAVATRRAYEATAVAGLGATASRQWAAVARSGAHAEVRAVEDQVLGADPGRAAAAAAPAAAWEAPHRELDGALAALERAVRPPAAGQGDPVVRALTGPDGIAASAGLCALLVSLAVALRFGRGLVTQLGALRDSARELAHGTLPEAIRRIRDGESIDIPTETPPAPADTVAPAADDEIAQVRAALESVHREALCAAAERAELAGAVSGVLVGLARRSQVLVHRQLALLDCMERCAGDPDTRGELIRLDQLTTRMRRHAESLIVLAGAAPGRTGRLPVPLPAVVRAAVSETEDGARVEPGPLPEISVSGAAASGLRHLLAELIENAAQFSPPNTRVRVSGEPVGTGCALEVEDRGLGMGREALAAANRRLGTPDAADLFDSDRLGLFVVSRLAARHGVKVSLRPSAYGGTTAVVLVPRALLQPEPEPEEEPEPEPEEEREEEPQPEQRQQPDPIPRNPKPGPGPVAQPALPTARPGGPEHARAGRETDDALPRRIRQAGLAPRLRTTPEPETEPDAGAGERTPDVARARMTAFAEGWARGRRSHATREGDRP
ncbi:nitrate- and nitrite sensing domain-containing protein [Streptomyces sp. NPDC001922]|uniref:nitrate- and nitrite sensing domain-containing protein n=1 Tax=Streptomyces sp. NPDC001922 TaxID=3364624 RepID=UPI0036B4245D